ncbi:Gfo/Idh/MocA family protein [Ornithinimicrobium avium]|nr:Gfo/Idh/MocA family oxidoreductase [Ornithinimicrobium avium]
MRYGIVGTGYFGAELARVAAALPEGAVTRVYSPEHAIPLAQEVGAQVAADALEVCIADDVEAVIVASPNDVHVEPALAAAAAGKHVFCEKPVALSYADAASMVGAARTAGVTFMAGHVTQFMHGVREARRRIADGEIGRLLVAQAARTGWEPPAEQVSWKKMRERSGGHLFHHIHELDLVLAVMGAAERVVMSGGNLAHRGAGHGDEDDVLLAVLEHEDGSRSQLQWGSAYRWPEHHVTFQGTLGAIRVDLQDVGVTMRTERGTTTWPLHSSWAEDAERREEYAAASGGGGVTYGAPGARPPGWLRRIMREELEWFEDVVAGRLEPERALAGLTDGQAALTSIATAEALTISLAEDRKVSTAEVSG